MRVGRYSVEITNANTIWFKQPKITKGEIVEYYNNIASHMLPYTKNRPLTMQRFPEGIHKEGFYHKNAPAYFPTWIERIPIKKAEDGIVNYVVANNRATLVYIANQGCITPHLFLSTVKNLKFPDQIIFDLDPPGDNFDIVRKTALDLHDLLIELGLVPFLKTTGSRGLHVIVPIKPTENFDTVRDFAFKIAQQMVDQNPKHRTLEIRKEKRCGRLFIDVMRNAFGQTAVAPYAVRARQGAPVATPLHWDELKDKKIRSDFYNIRTIFKRLDKIDDPWRDIKKSARSIQALR